jgi:hypothetical protein
VSATSDAQAKTLMAKSAPITEAPTPAAPITVQHRASASVRGFSIDATIAALRLSLGEARFALEAIIGAAPEGDGNVTALRSLHRKPLAFGGTVDLLAPTAVRTHTMYS